MQDLVGLRSLGHRGGHVVGLAELADVVTDNLIVVHVAVDQLHRADLALSEVERQQLGWEAVEGADAGCAEFIPEVGCLAATFPLGVRVNGLDVGAAEAGVELGEIELDLVPAEQPKQRRVGDARSLVGEQQPERRGHHQQEDQEGFLEAVFLFSHAFSFVRVQFVGVCRQPVSAC